MKKTIRNAGTAALAPLLLAACSFGGGAAPEDNEAERSAIKVMYYDEMSFFREIGNMFMMQHPDIDVEVVSNQSIYQSGKHPIDGLKELVEKERPDVLFASGNYFSALLEDGMLYELDALVAKEEGFLDGVLPAAIEKLRLMGGGKLYGLSPSFSSQAVFYNKALFEEHGVPLPADGMTWDALIDLAELFPKDGTEEERVYGLQPLSGGGSYMMFQLGREQGLRFLDLDARRVTLNTDSWKRVADTVLRLSRSEAVYTPEPWEPQMGETYEDHLRRDPFLTGRLAMRMEYSYYVDQLKQAADRLPEADGLEWDLASMPVSPEAPDRTSSFELSNTFAIFAESPNVEAAWSFVKFINSDDFARATSRAPVMGGLPVRTEYISNEDGKNFEAFYAMAPASSATETDLAALPMTFSQRFFEMIDGIWQSVVANELSVEDALMRMETEGQAMLDAAFENGEFDAESGEAANAEAGEGGN